MITDASVENYYITKIREQFPDFKIPPRAPTLTLYDALDALSLYRFKDLLEKTGMIDLLKQPSFLMLIAPIDAAFDVIDPLVRQELEGEYASARLNTLARTHIVPATTLFRESGESIEPNCDMNGALLNVQVTAIKDFVGSVIPPRYFINAVQGVRPFEPSPIGSLRVANGNIILVPKVLIGKTLLEQKYRDMYRRFFQTGEESTKYTSWEALKNVGLTQFCNLIERAGFIELLNSPAENQQKLRVLAPIDEAFAGIGDDVTADASDAQWCVKRHIIDTQGKNLLGEKIAYSPDSEKLLALIGEKFIPVPQSEILFAPAGKFKSSNGEFLLTTKCLFGQHNRPSWNFVPDMD